MALSDFICCTNQNHLQSGRERQMLYDITYVWDLKEYKSTYLQNRNRLTDIENKPKVTKGEGEEEG